MIPRKRFNTESTEAEPEQTEATEFLIPKDPSTNALLQAHYIEINEKANTLPTELQIREKLRLVNGKNRLHGFDLNDNLLFDEQVDSISGLDRYSVVHDGKDLLGFERNVHSLQFVAQTYLIRSFKQARSQPRMHPISGTDNAVCCSTVYKPCPAVVRGRVLRVGAFFCEQEMVQD